MTSDLSGFASPLSGFYLDINAHDLCFGSSRPDPNITHFPRSLLLSFSSEPAVYYSAGWDFPESAKQSLSILWIFSSDSAGDKASCRTRPRCFSGGRGRPLFFSFRGSEKQERGECVCLVLSTSELWTCLSDCNHHCLHFAPLQVCNLVWDIDVDRCGESR